MQATRARPISGHVFRVEGKRGAVWYAKYRLPDGRQVQKRLGPAWTQRGRPPADHLTKRTAEAWLSDTLDAARRGTLPGMVRTGATFADAAAEWLRYVEHERACKPSTMDDYRQMVGRLNLVFGTLPIESITRQELERWKGETSATRRISNRTVQKYLVVLNGIFKRAMRVWNLPTNPAAAVERPRLVRKANIDVFAGEEVMALVRAADSEQDAAIYTTAAFTGLRQGELLALRWRDVDFGLELIHVRANFTHGREGTTKSGRERAVPMMPEVAQVLAKLGQRERFTAPSDLVFCSRLGGYLSPKHLTTRYQRSNEPSSGGSASTTCATPSARTRSALPTLAR
jgi:integrase